MMLEYTDIPEARWYQLESDDKRSARLVCLRHILDAIPYQDVTPAPIDLPPRPPDDVHYVRPPREKHTILPRYTDHRK